LGTASGGLLLAGHFQSTAIKGEKLWLTNATTMKTTTIRTDRDKAIRVTLKMTRSAPAKPVKKAAKHPKAAAAPSKIEEMMIEWKPFAGLPLDLSYTAFMMTVAFVPPKPNELERATLIFLSLAILGTRSSPLQGSDTFSRLSVGGRMPVSIALIE